MNKISIYQWPKNKEYPSLNCIEVEIDIENIQKRLSSLDDIAMKMSLIETDPKLLMSLFAQVESDYWNTRSLIDEFYFLGYSELALNIKNQQALKMANLAEKFTVLLEQRLVLFLRMFNKLLFSSQVSNYSESNPFTEYSSSHYAHLNHFYFLRKSREIRQLSDETENIIAMLSSSGVTSWRQLYKEAMGEIEFSCNIEGKPTKIGAALAFTYLQHPNRTIRRTIWQGLQKEWRTKEHRICKVLNSIVYWNINVHRIRYPESPNDFMNPILQSHCLSQESVTAMVNATKRGKSTLQRGLQICTKMMGVSKMEPWDMFAPSPWNNLLGELSLTDACQKIQDAFKPIFPEFSDFIRFVTQNQIIDAEPKPHRRPGAFCAYLPKTKTIRVFNTWGKSLVSMGILTHELGHAFHFWLLKDESYHGSSWPPSLEEIPSTFAEICLVEQLIQSTTDLLEKKIYLWQKILYSTLVLLGSSATLDLERKIYEARSKNYLTVNDLNALSTEVYRKWYGDSVSTTGKSWLQQRHYYVAEEPFASVRYIFGYFIARVLSKKQQEMGQSFFPKWKSFVKNLHLADVNDLFKDHFDIDLSTKEVWDIGLQSIADDITQFENLLDK
jgi:oligoendopeptidase F